jgi:succinate dehydrogenase / fumarate reductase cytochrome b subunit
VIVGFSAWTVVVAYMIAMAALGLHLRHGAWSMLQTLGASHPRWDGLRNMAATVFTVIIVLGFVSVPLAVAAGVLK